MVKDLGDFNMFALFGLRFASVTESGILQEHWLDLIGINLCEETL